jgi:ATP-binding cassette subfamily B protein
MGFFSGLEAEAYDRTYGDRVLARRMAARFRPQARRLWGIAATVVVVSLSYVAFPLFFAQSVNLMAAHGSPSGMWLIAGALFAVGFITWVANWGRRRLTARAVADVMLALRQDAFAATAGHDLSFHDQFSSGRIVSRITSDTQDFAQVMELVTDLLSQFLEAGVMLIVILRIDWRLTLLILGFLPVVMLVALAFRRLARRVTQRGFRAMANVNAAIKEAVTGIAVAKNFRQEDAIYGQFDDVNQVSYRMNVRRGFVLSLVFPTLNVLGGVGTGLIVYLGGLSAAQGLVTLGAWYLFIRSLDSFWFPMLNLSSFWSQVQNGLSAAERVFALIDAEVAVVQTDHKPVPPLRGEIDFIHLDFHYVAEEEVLEDFSLHIAAGENVALVGHTGAGKTSIAKLVGRFYEFQGGRLLIDGQDIRTFDLQQYRRQLGIVPQAPFLFSGTVMENIRYAAPQATEDMICELAMRVGQGEWLEALPEGLESEVGERGVRLSMGQRQMVSLMRVLAQKPAIFILDEATASIDPFTEMQIQEALRLILAESTSILIAHRLSTVRAADRIIVLEKGRIIEEGNHRSLLAAGGHYADLYNTYFRHQSPEYRPWGLEAVDGRLMTHGNARQDAT